jgi:lysophospholipase L1-like esterase
MTGASASGSTGDLPDEDTSTGDSPGTGSSATSTTGSGPTTDASTTGPGPDPSGGSTGENVGFGGLDTLGSLVILGDSIGDGGGQGPYYYELLRDSLAGHYGPIEYRNRAQSGSETGALREQISGLSDSLPGPVAVVITSGGNDMKGALGQVILGADGTLRAQVQANIQGAIGDLTAPGRFGPGVEVYVFEANIYDSSDGLGNFGQADCAFAGGLPPIASDPLFDRWNSDIEATVSDMGQTPIDMHGYFYGHGFNSAMNWYASDCTHPNSVGHSELRDLLFETITGQ